VKVAILFDGASAEAETPDQEILETVSAVSLSLTTEGNTVVRIPVHPDARWIDRLRRARVDLVFNLCESIDGVAALEPAVIDLTPRGTIFVLLLALKEKKIVFDEFMQALNELIDAGFRLKEEVYVQAIKEATKLAKKP
jgi:hypothetical protein